MKLHRISLQSHFLAPALILAAAFLVAGMLMFTSIGHALAQTYNMRFDGASEYPGFFMCGGGYNIYTGTYDWSGGNTCTFSCDAAHSGQTCSITTTVGSIPDTTCINDGRLSACPATPLCRTESYTCVYTPPACTANNACAANTCSTGTCNDSCGNSYAGTKNCSVACTATNSCGMSNSGTLVNGVCSASAPSDGLCPSAPDSAVGCGAEVPTGINCVGGEPTFSTCSPTQMGYTRGTATTKSCGGGGFSITDNWGYCQADASCSYSQAYYQSYYQGYYQASYAPSYSEGYYQSSYYSQSSYAPSCTSPSVTVTASPVRVKSGQTSTLTVTGTGITTSCTITGPGVSQTIAASSCNASRTVTTPALTASSKYTVTCDSGAATAYIIVNTAFGVIEF